MLNFKKIDLKSDHFPYCVSDKVFNDEIYDGLLKDFPIIDDQRLGQEKFQGGRVRISRGSTEYKELLKKSEYFNNLDKYLSGIKFPNYIKALFGLTHDQTKKNFLNQKIKTKINHLYSKIFNKNPYSLSIDISISGKGYVNKIHNDRNHRYLIMLIFFSDKNEENMTGGDFIAHKFKSENNSYDFSNDRFFNEHECEVLETISPQHNRGVIFLNTEQSLHSVNEIKNITGQRKFIYIALNY